MNEDEKNKKQEILQKIKNRIDQEILAGGFPFIQKTLGIHQSRWFQVPIPKIKTDVHYEIIFYKKELYIELHIENKAKSDFLKPLLTVDTNKYQWFQKRSMSKENQQRYRVPFHITSLQSFSYDAIDDTVIEKIITILQGFDRDFSIQLEQCLKDFVPENKKTTLRPPKNMFSRNIPLNQILYGPPGTGKTYNTINTALEILDPEFLAKNSDTSKTARKNIHSRFQELKNKGQIEFVTFHQSYGYEDFIEGITANIETEEISYTMKTGVFKGLCERAKEIKAINTLTQFSFEKNNIFKMSLGGDAKKEIKEWCLENDLLALGWGGNIDFSHLASVSNKEEFKKIAIEKLHIAPDDWAIQALYKFIHGIKVGDLILVSDGNSTLSAIGEVTGEYMFNDEEEIQYAQFRSVKWIIKDVKIPIQQIYKKKFSQQALYKMIPKYFQKTELLKLLEINKKDSQNKKYLIIIDEINRGNISKIFGELITLIEPSKRKGNTESIEVTLPASQETFSIPNNVYIIGTMNTADRSIALLDTALRRRFEFREMMPQPALLSQNNSGIPEINLSQLLISINNRIEYLYDRDHCIGHAYFMQIESFDGIKHVFSTKIIPLLQEYFYDDWEKISLILGGKDNDFIREKPLFSSDHIFKNTLPDSFQYDEKMFYEVSPIDTWTVQSFINIYSEKGNEH